MKRILLIMVLGYLIGMYIGFTIKNQLNIPHSVNIGACIMLIIVLFKELWKEWKIIQANIEIEKGMKDFLKDLE